jgi:hypothetical protein
MSECIEVVEKNQDDISRKAGVYLYMGSQVWQENNLIHREDGPAITGPDGTERWYINGKEITPQVKALFRENKWVLSKGLDTPDKVSEFKAKFVSA